MKKYKELSEEIIREMKEGRFNRRKWREFRRVYKKMVDCLKKNKLQDLTNKNFIVYIKKQERRENMGKRKKRKEGSVIGIISHKGGVGKTFLAKHLIYLLGNLGYRVLGIDYDTQGDLMKWATGYKWQGEKFVEEELYDLMYSPGKIDVKELKREYDFIVVDGRPDYEGIVKLVSSLDLLIIPVEGRLSVEGARDVLEIISVVPKKDVDILLIRNKLTRQAMDINKREAGIVRALADEYGVTFYIVSIVYTEAVRVAEFEGKNAWEFPGNMGRGIAVALGSIANWISKNYGDAEKVYSLSKMKEEK